MINEITASELIANLDQYDLIIDVRSPHEYAESHLPQAVNYYALDDAQHKEIGTIYKQQSAFEAKVKGAAYVCLNAAEHIKKLYPAFTPQHRIAIYCARGGMRSTSISTIFSNIGYRIDRVKGGYKAYRHAVLDFLDDFPAQPFIVLGGNTGCGKSDLLEHLDNTVDLEGMANHYGSAFGAVNGPQPTMKMFQNMLVHALLRCDPNRPAFIESESKKIGKLTLPKRLYEMMQAGHRVEITAPLDQRVARIIRMYEGIDSAFFDEAMRTIAPYIKKSAKEEAIEAFASGDLATVAAILLEEYYDVVYKKSARIDTALHNDDETQTLNRLTQLQKELT